MWLRGLVCLFTYLCLHFVSCMFLHLCAFCILKDKSITITTKKKLLHTIVFSIASDGSECWLLKNIDKRKIETFELWCYHHLLRIS